MPNTHVNPHEKPKTVMGKYDGIIDLPHHVSPKRSPMTRVNRAAQFSPFAALTGYEDAVSETARLTDAKIELTEESRAELDRKQQKLAEMLHEHPTVTVTYFLPDSKKCGGSYQTVTAPLRGVDSVERLLRLGNGNSISLDDILDLQSDVLE